MKKQNPKKFSRRKFLATGIMGAAGAFSYARWIEPGHLSITKKEITLPTLPPSLDGLVIAQMTDFHYEPDRHAGLMQSAVAAVNAAKPDIIALTGDFITGSQKVFDPLMAILSRLEAKHGIYAILGNHDGWHGSLSRFKNGFNSAGFEFLRNHGSRIRIGSDHLFILGTDSVWSGTVDATACYRGHAGEPVLALVHEPDVFDSLTADHPVSLQLSGHTHGGQCRVPFIGYAPVKVRYGRNYIYGEYAKENSRIFVSRGLGTVGMPIRFACAPEVAILTLRAGNTA